MNGISNILPFLTFVSRYSVANGGILKATDFLISPYRFLRPFMKVNYLYFYVSKVVRKLSYFFWFSLNNELE